MRSAELSGMVMIVLGLAILFLLRDVMIRLIILFIEFLGVIIGFFLVVVGVGLLLGGRWIRRQRYWRYRYNSGEGAGQTQG